MEEKFVKMFIQKQYQDRLRFELTSKKREKAINRFSHNAKQLLKENLILKQGEKISKEDIEKVFKKETNKDVYLISLNPIYDQKLEGFSSAINIFFDEFLPMIIIGESFALIRQETSGNASIKFLLSEKL